MPTIGNERNIIRTTLPAPAPREANPQVRPAPRQTNRAAVVSDPEPVLSDDLRALIVNQSHWKSEIETRKEREAALTAELTGIISRIVDTTGEGEKNALRAKRAARKQELDMLAEELAECQRRYDAASQAVLDYKIQAAEAVYKAADTVARAKREVLITAQNDNLSFMNAGRRISENEDSILQKKQIDISIATAQAELTIANRAKERAGRALQELQAQR